MNVLRYQDYIGSIEVDIENQCLHGKILYINDLVTYEAQTIKQLEVEFHKAADDYIQTCKELNREPKKSFKGSLNVRLGPELHTRAAVHAAILGIAINEYIKLAIRHQIKQDNY